MRVPGFGLRRPVDDLLDRLDERVERVAAGRGAPGSGIISARSLRIIFSDIGELLSAASTSNFSSDRLPDITCSL